MGRATQGVKLINLREGDEIAAVAKVISEDEQQEDSTEELSAETAADTASLQGPSDEQ